MKQYLIPQTLLQGLCDYLVTKPFKEVANILGALQALPVLDESPEKPPEGDNDGTAKNT
jgi:hypothetical protein